LENFIFPDWLHLQTRLLGQYARANAGFYFAGLQRENPPSPSAFSKATMLDQPSSIARHSAFSVRSSARLRRKSRIASSLQQSQ
jgi:hypothetical protein